MPSRLDLHLAEVNGFGRAGCKARVNPPTQHLYARMDSVHSGDRGRCPSPAALRPRRHRPPGESQTPGPGSSATSAPARGGPYLSGGRGAAGQAPPALPRQRLTHHHDHRPREISRDRTRRGRPARRARRHFRKRWWWLKLVVVLCRVRDASPQP